MNNMKNYIVGGIAVVALVLAFLAYTKPGQTIVQQLGSASSPSIVGGCMELNGITKCYSTSGFSQASTTLCSIRTPGATSTLQYAGASITTASTSALQFEWGKSTVPDATTTPLGIYNLASTIRAVVMASTTVGGNSAALAADTPLIFGPNMRINLKYGGSLCPTATGAACNSLVGKCSVEFLVN